MLTTAITGGMLSMIHPGLMLLLGYDVYLLFKSMAVMNQTVDMIVLHNNKKDVRMSKVNFLGYHKEGHAVLPLSEIRFIGKVENTSVLLDNYGLLPSIGRMLRRKEDIEMA